MTERAEEIRLAMWNNEKWALNLVPKRITLSLIKRTEKVLELEIMLMALTQKMADLLLFSRDTYVTCDSAIYCSLSLRAIELLEKLQTINPAVRDGYCKYVELNLGDFLC